MAERHFSDDEASRIWRRAAELQNARRLPGARGDHGESSDALSATDIVAIAGEAGIDAAFVEQALSEAAFTPVAMADDSAFHVVRELEGELGEVQAAVQDVATRAPFDMRLLDIRAVENARALVFGLNGTWGAPLQAGSLAAANNIAALHVLLRPGSRADRTEMVLHGEENPTLPVSVRRHDIGFGIGGGVFGAMGGLGAGVGFALTGAALVATGAAGAIGLGAAGIWIIRKAQGAAQRKDVRSLDQLAMEIAGAVRIRRHAS